MKEKVTSTSITTTPSTTATTAFTSNSTCSTSTSAYGTSPSFGASLADVGVRRTLVDLICTMNASFPDYDFSGVRPDNFDKEASVSLVRNKVGRGRCGRGGGGSMSDWVGGWWVMMSEEVGWWVNCRWWVGGWVGQSVSALAGKPVGRSLRPFVRLEKSCS